MRALSHVSAIVEKDEGNCGGDGLVKSSLTSVPGNGGTELPSTCPENTACRRIGGTTTVTRRQSTLPCGQAKRRCLYDLLLPSPLSPSLSGRDGLRDHVSREDGTSLHVLLGQGGFDQYAHVTTSPFITRILPTFRIPTWIK